MKKIFALMLMSLLWCHVTAGVVTPNGSSIARLTLPSTTGTSVLVPQVADDYEVSALKVSALPFKASALAGAAATLRQGAAVMTFESLNSNVAPAGGIGVEIEEVEDVASRYRIVNFYDTGLTVEFDTDAALTSFTIASQKIVSQDGIGDVYVAFCTSNGNPDYTVPLTGTIDADGTLNIDSWWGLYVKGGEYDGQPLGWFYDTKFRAANAMMRQTPADGSDPEEYGVVVTQTGNILNVLNFANHGQEVEVIINDERSGQIDQQVVWKHVSQGNVYCSGYSPISDTQINIVPTIRLNKAGGLRSVSWNNWTIFNSNGYFNLWSDGCIDTDFDIVYPIEVTGLDGSGTEADPWLIRTVNDLNFVARSCLNDGTKGAYYALANDIDMTGFRFVPIGDAEHPFEGVLDGKNFTLSNLSIEAAANYTGLVGFASATSELRNIKLFKPTVSSTGRYTAALVGYSDGLIDNCHVNQGTVGSNYAVVAGVAGHVCHISNSTATMTQVVGLGGTVAGMVSYLNGSMTNCQANDVIVYTGTQSALTASGGLVAIANTGSEITDSHFGGLLSGSPTYNVAQVLGGIVGSADNCNIERCFVVADIKGFQNNAVTGGIAGLFMGTINDCYVAGRVNSTASVTTGGLVGYVQGSQPSTITNSYVSAHVDAASGTTKSACREIVGECGEAGLTLQNTWFDNQMTSALGSQTNGVPTATLTAAGGIDGFDAGVWQFAAGLYPRLKSDANSHVSQLSATAIEFDTVDNLEKITRNTVVNVAGETFPLFVVNGQYTAQGRGASILRRSDSQYVLSLNDSFATDTLVMVNNAVQYVLQVVKFAPSAFDGDGTEASPYLIKTKDDLLRLAQLTSIDRQPFNGAYFLMTNDIDMSGVENFPGIGCLEFSTAVSFGGKFDGGNHSIHNLKLGGIIWTVEPSDPDNSWLDGEYATTGQPAFNALFGTINANGYVKNLVMADDCQFDGGSYVASIAINNSGNISNCRNYARVRSLRGYGAGITVSNAGTVTDCYNAGDVLVNSSYAAGIVCYNGGVVRRAVNVGDISTKQIAKTVDDKNQRYAGGIVAYATGRLVEDVVNAGTVYSATGDVGGIIAYNPHYGDGVNYNALVRAVNYGMVSGTVPSCVGSIVGTGVTGGKVENVYWDNQILPIMPEANSTHNGMTAASTAQLTSGSAFDGFDPEVWTFAKGVYPMLTFVAEEIKAQAAAHAVLTLADGETTRNIHSDGALAQYDGLTWTLADASQFSISGSVLNTPTTVETRITDRLTVSGSGYAKFIDIASAPEVPLLGNGTFDDPYQLSSAADWNSLSTYMWSNKIDLEGEFVKVMNDIDFSGVEFKPIAIGGDKFSGTLLGNGKELKGINHTFGLALNLDGTTIRNSQGKQGAIGMLGASGTIADLTISGTFTQTSQTYSGVFAGEVYGVIRNCVNKATLTGTKSYRGGIAAIGYEGAKFIDCVNRGRVTWTSGSTGNGGGILAEAKGPVTFERCGNEGEVNGGSTYHAGIVAVAVPSTFIECYNTADLTNDISYFAGIVANANGSTNYKTTDGYRYVFDRCYNTGNISAKGNVAGLVGTCGYSNCAFDAYNCYNTGNITSAGTVGTAAGLFVSIGGQSNIVDCYNTGDVKSLNGKSYAAGIAKETKSGAEATPNRLVRCWNSGNVSSDAALAAGLIVQPGAWTLLDSCYNEGAVTTKTYSVGGIYGNTFNDNVVLNNCYNTGTITAGGTNVGGLIGNSQTARVSAYNCVNFGEVKSTGTTQGSSTSGATDGNNVGGLAGVSGGQFVNCYNAGTVTGTNMVGGLVGQPYAYTNPSNNTTVALGIDHCYNVGAVVAPAAESGAIVGVDAEATDANVTAKYWNTAVRVADTYYLASTSASTLTPAGTGLTAAELAQLEMGEGWHSADDYSFPALDVHADHHAGHLHAAAVIPAEGDDYDRITQPFKVGRPEHVVWTASIPGVNANGNNVELPDGVWSGKLVMTATAGAYTKSYELNLDTVTSIDDIDDDEVDVVSETWYDLAGVRIADGDAVSGRPYIIIRTYSNGTARPFKVVK